MPFFLTIVMNEVVYALRNGERAEMKSMKSVAKKLGYYESVLEK